MDLEKYRKLFIDEGTEHLAEMGRALLDLEKDPASDEALEVVFRMAHSMKSMAASLGYDSISEVAHKLEDHMQEVRARGHVSGHDEMVLLFRGLEGLEAMLVVVRDSGKAPPPDPELLKILEAVPPSSPSEGDLKKALR